MAHLEEEQRDLLLDVILAADDDELIPAVELAQLRLILEEAEDEEVELDDEQLSFLRDAIDASEELALDERIDLLSALQSSPSDD